MSCRGKRRPLTRYLFFASEGFCWSGERDDLSLECCYSWSLKVYSTVKERQDERVNERMEERER